MAIFEFNPKLGVRESFNNSPSEFYHFLLASHKLPCNYSKLLLKKQEEFVHFFELGFVATRTNCLFFAF